MKIPKIKIVWGEKMKIPKEINIVEISNGYLVGDNYFANKELVLAYLIEVIKNQIK
jgi:hypothetical protein